MSRKGTWKAPSLKTFKCRLLCYWLLNNENAGDFEKHRTKECEHVDV